MAEHHDTFADETTTGRFLPEYRHLGRATIAARAHDVSGFEWIEKLRQDLFPNDRELDSSKLIAAMRGDPRLRDFVHEKVSEFTIAIIDFAQHNEFLIRSFAEQFAAALPAGVDPLKYLRRRGIPEAVDLILRYAREHSIRRSTIPRIERLLQEVIQEACIPSGIENELFDQEALYRMPEDKFQELVARFSLALADSLHPLNQAKAIADSLRENRFMQDGHIAFLTLRGALEINKTYDVGAEDVFDMVSAAHAYIGDILSQAADTYYFMTMKPGAVRQEDSRKLLGIQAADIAAAIAREEFEAHPRSARDGATAVRRLFGRVMLNGEFV